MSDTTVEYLPGVAGGVAAYVREVRAELSDLPAEDVDDLTGGMEADLTELAAESGGDLTGRLGSPKVYAAELRAAAGLPDRVAGRVRSRPLAEVLTHARDSFTLLTEQRPWLREVVAFLVTLRPAWWLIRGYLAAWAFSFFLGSMRGVWLNGRLPLAMALVAIVVSVQLGRGWLRHWAGLRPLLVLGNAVAVVVALAFLTVGVASGEASPVTYSPPSGVLLNGEQVGNIYAYDSDGRRITGVRLFDQGGRPLNGDQGSDANGSPVAVDPIGRPLGVVRDSSGAPLLNVYPRALVGSDPWQIANPANPAQSDGIMPTWSPPLSIVPLVSSSPAPAPATPTSPVTGTTPATSPTSPEKSTSTRAPTAKPVQPKPVQPKSVQPKSVAPGPSSVPRPSVTRSGG
jgi:hypothetical protein